MIIVGLLRGSGLFLKVQYIYHEFKLVGAQTPTNCSFARHLVEKMAILCDSHQAENHSSIGKYSSSMRALWGWNGPMGIRLFAKKKKRNLESLPISIKHLWTFQYAKAGMWPNVQQQETFWKDRLPKPNHPNEFHRFWMLVLLSWLGISWIRQHLKSNICVIFHGLMNSADVSKYYSVGPYQLWVGLKLHLEGV